jgi:two-component system sensor histidine kinase AlgZ
VAAVFLILVLTALVLSLARQSDILQLWIDLTRIALFLLWVGLLCAAALCRLRPRLESLPVVRASVLSVATIVLVITLVSVVALLVSRSSLLTQFSDVLPFQSQPWRFLISNVAIGAIVGALAVRYFYVLGEWERNVELHSRARLHALQARIRPHFLYNSLNTIAALTTSDPAKAEAAVQDLADLFRANLSEQRGNITLREELEMARIYQRIEQLRLGDRLHVVWSVTDLPMQTRVPSLLVQPLLENAIIHGIEPLPAGGTVHITGQCDGDMLCLSVRNPLPRVTVKRLGSNQVALANIRERMELMYHGNASVEVSSTAEEFVVQLRFPGNAQQRESSL